MSRLRLTFPGAALAALASQAGSAQGVGPELTGTNDVVTLPSMQIEARNLPDPLWEQSAPLDTREWSPSAARRSAVADAADLLQDAPGASVVRNGPLTGIVQLRGLRNERVHLLVDGMTLTPACPNHMDPPLHYVDPAAVRRIAVMAGITPVSAGGDSIAGTVILDAPYPAFSTNLTWKAQGSAGVTVNTANEGLALRGSAGAADDTLSAAWSGSWRNGNDYRYPEGRVRDTSYDIQQHQVTVAAQTRTTLWSADAGLTRTRDTGTPALPMDMIEDDGWRVGLRQEGTYAFGRLETRLYHHETDHLMDNYSLRPAGPMRMFSPAESDDTGLRAGAAIPVSDHLLGVGAEAHFNAFDAYQQNAVTGMRQDTLNDSWRFRAGAYAEFLAELTSRWTAQVGARVDGVVMSADPVEQWFAASARDAALFNATDRDQDDVNFDATAAVRFKATEGLTLELAGARKSRAPSLLERYLWTPLSASAGQADGRTYLGNLELDPEISHQVAFSAALQDGSWQFKVSPFYQWVAEFIQGTPIARNDTSGRPVLQYQNLSQAELYGVDASARWSPIAAFSLLGSLGYVRGKNLDNDDNLYRIAPLQGTVAAEVHWGGWTGTAEVILAASQDKVAAYNGESPTDGYAVLNFGVAYRASQRFEIILAVNNVLDALYAEHVGGINRVLGSDVPVGEHLPGLGRHLSLAVNVHF